MIFIIKFVLFFDLAIMSISRNWNSVSQIRCALDDLSEYIIDMSQKLEYFKNWAHEPYNLLKQALVISDNEALASIKDKSVIMLVALNNTGMQPFIGSFHIATLTELMYFGKRADIFPFGTLMWYIFDYFYCDIKDCHTIIGQFHAKVNKYIKQIHLLANFVETVDDLCVLSIDDLPEPEFIEKISNIVTDNVHLMKEILEHGSILDNVVYTIEEDIKKIGIPKYAEYAHNDIEQQFATEKEKYFADKLKVCITDFLILHGSDGKDQEAQM